MIYEKEFKKYVNIFKIQDNNYYFYLYDTGTIVKYISLDSNEFEVIIIFRDECILDFNIIGSNLYILSSIGIHYIDLMKRNDESLILRTKNTSKLITLDNNYLIFNFNNRIIFAFFKFKKIKIKKKLIDQSRNLLLVDKVFDSDHIDTFTYSYKMNKLLILDDHSIITENNKELFQVQFKHNISIMINNYYIYAICSNLYIIRKDKYKWSNEHKMNMDEGYVVNGLQSKDDSLYILACNYEKMNCRIYVLKIKNIIIS
jgi:hypothetical protein